MEPVQGEPSASLEEDSSHPAPPSNAIRLRVRRRPPWPTAGTEWVLSNLLQGPLDIRTADSKLRKDPAYLPAIEAPGPTGSVCRPACVVLLQAGHSSIAQTLECMSSR